jgi:hypothetical protein
MKRLINLRGANGSGKTYLIRRWMQLQQAEPYPRRNNLLGSRIAFKAPEYYLLKDGGCVIGDYTKTNTNVKVGCDLIPTQEEIRLRIFRQSGVRYVLFEGIIVSTIFHSWLAFSRSLGGMLWVYLDTPLKICLERIYRRNNGKEIKEELVAHKIRRIDSTRRKAQLAGEQVVLIHWENAEEEFDKLMSQYS